MARKQSKEAADLLWNCFSFTFSLIYLAWQYFKERSNT